MITYFYWILTIVLAETVTIAGARANHPIWGAGIVAAVLSVGATLYYFLILSRGMQLHRR